MSRERVSIKGTNTGVIVTIGAGDWQTILTQIALKLDQKASFFKGGRVALAVGSRLLNVAELEIIGNLFAGHKMTLWAVSTDAPETRAAAESLGLEAEVAAPSSKSNAVVATADTTTNSALTIRRTMRSGQSIEYPGNIVIVGDVNPGAKITAGGHVIVWGRLRGTVHAGAANPENAFVCALQLAPMQLIIGSTISRSPAGDAPDEIVPEMAVVQNGRIVAEAWG